MNTKRLLIVVPCYNEEAVLQETNRVLLGVCDELANKQALEAGILYVDDGSRDATWAMVKAFAAADARIRGAKLAHNRGHQQALWAGLERAAREADAAVSIDADLQDDPQAILQMAAAWTAGNDIVYGVRRERKTDTLFKRWTAQGFYKFLRTLGGDVLYNHADFRLMSCRALEALMEFPERNIFLRGMVYSLGFPHTEVYYNRTPRMAGESKYPLSRMLSFALDGITSFSVRPLRFIVYSGLLFILVSLCAIVYGLVSWSSGRAVPGWASIIVSLWFIGGFILLAIGIIGEYVGKIYSEVKRRPRYAIEESI